MELNRLDRCASCGTINHMGHLNPCCTAVHHLDEILPVVGAWTHDRRHPACLRGHNHQLDCLERDRPVLAIDEHPIEANTARHLDQLGGGYLTERPRAGSPAASLAFILLVCIKGSPVLRHPCEGTRPRRQGPALAL